VKESRTTLRSGIITRLEALGDEPQRSSSFSFEVVKSENNNQAAVAPESRLCREGVVLLITVKFFAGFRKGRFPARKVDFAGPTTVAEVLERFDVPAAEVGVLLCNGRHVDFSHSLAAGDTLSIFPKVGGG